MVSPSLLLLLICKIILRQLNHRGSVPHQVLPCSLYRPKYDSPITVDNEAQVATNQPFDGPAPDKLKAAVLKTPADAVGWTFEIDSDGVITATAPSVDELAQHYARLTQGTDVDWDTIETVLRSVAKPEVFVDFIYEDDSVAVSYTHLTLPTTPYV